MMKKTIFLLSLLLTFVSFSQATLAKQAVKAIPYASEALEKVNVNTASAEEIADVLHGVGDKKAQLIVDYREKHGEFKYIDDLKEVKGIGDATIRKNKDKIIL
jgi:competence protein ComEA